MNVGEQAPNFKVVDANFSPVKLADFANKVVLISVVPSLDTGFVHFKLNALMKKLASYPITL